MNDDELPRTSLDKLREFNDALVALSTLLLVALEKDLMRIVNFLKGIT